MERQEDQEGERAKSKNVNSAVKFKGKAFRTAVVMSLGGSCIGGLKSP